MPFGVDEPDAERVASENITARISLPHDASAPALARQFIDEHRDHLDPSLIEDAQLLVTEIVTNAVRHGRPQIVVELRLEPPALGIAVADAGAHMPDRPAVMPVDPAATGGRGLGIVDALATQWGVIPGDGAAGKIVWFDIYPR